MQPRILLVSTVLFIYTVTLVYPILEVAAAEPKEQGLAVQLCGDCNANSKLTVDELIVAVRMSLSGCPVAGACCGDCDLNQRVEINELVTAVNNLLYYEDFAACGLFCFGPCYFPIPGDPPCPCTGGECTEVVVLMEPDRTIQCGTSLCYVTDEQFRSCVLLINRATTFCHEEPPQ